MSRVVAVRAAHAVFQPLATYTLGLCVALTVSCHRVRKLEPASVDAGSGGKRSTSEPELSLSPARLELGDLLVNQSIERSVDLSNRSAKVVQFREVASSSRCVWLTPLTELPAHSKVARVVRCQSDLVGPLKEQLSLVQEPPGMPPTVLEVTGSVTPLLAFDMPFIDLRPDFGQTVHADVRVIGAKVNEARLTLEPVVSPVASATPITTPKGEAPRFRLTCRATQVGMHAGSLVVRTGLQEPAAISVSFSCRVSATLEVNPSNPYFNLKVSGDKAVSVEVKSSQPGFDVRSVRVKDGPFAAAIESRDSTGAVRIGIRVVNSKIPDETRSASGTLVIESNDAREPHKEVPLFGFGQINKVERPD